MSATRVILEARVRDALSGASRLRSGVALAEVRDRELWRESYDSFEAYLADRWHMSLAEGERLIADGLSSGVEL